MGRTLPSYRRMIEKERAIWQRNYAARLREPHRTSFAELWLYVFQLADAASANTRPIVFDNVMMSMLIGQHSEIQRLKDELAKLKRSVDQITEERGV
ncbi:MAG: hypothetical protein JSV04_07350 [Candidatus Heimdallarchaeota archaeon]|nr:MAG: hypothetical protein JSV04_07350 [Candidatus Heimdallarchaeota archaeon]